ncbi:MAG: fibronectin type III domain-containing protein, partial [Elusimicrobiota bacterium]
MLSRIRRTALIISGCCAGALLSAAAGTFSAPAVNSGGADAMSSGSSLLSGAVGELSFSTSSSASILRAGSLEVRSFPGTVSTLEAVSESSTSLTLSWTAPGYDGGRGTHQPGTRCALQRETSEAGPFQYALAQESLWTLGAEPGQEQQTLLSGLQPNTTYYSQLWTLDADGNISSGSNRAAAATLPILAHGAQFKSVFTTSITANWVPLASAPPADTAEGYRLEASSTDYGTLYPGGDILSSATTNVGLSTLAVAGLAPDTTYYFRLGALGHDGGANYLAFGSTKTLKGAVPPGNVRAEWTIEHEIALAWSPVNSDLGYRTEASTASDFTGSVYSATTDDGMASQLSITGLDPNTTYYCRTASLWSADTKYSATVSTPTLAVQPSGAAYKALFITSATVTWLPLPSSPPDASSKTAKGYRLEASSTDFGALEPGGIIFSSTTLNAALSTLTLTGLDVNTTFYFRLASLNWALAPDYAVLGETATLSSPPGPGSPSIQASFISSITAQWAAGTPANLPGETYALRASSTAFQPGTLTLFLETTDMNGAIEGLLTDTTYTLRVRTVNRNGIPAETLLGSTVTSAQPPGSVQITTVFESSASAAWTSVVSQGYRLEASSTNFGATAPGGTNYSSSTPNGSLTGLTVAGLDKNTTYYLRVAALNWNSHPQFASAGSTITKAALITNLQVYSLYETSATLNWVKLPASPQSATCEGYRLQASSTDFGALSPGGTILSSMTPNVNLSTLSLTGLLASTTYYFRAGALNWNSVP